MNRANLEERIQSLTMQVEQFRQQYAVLNAHLSESKFWLDELDKLELASAQQPVAESEPVASEELVQE